MNHTPDFFTQLSDLESGAADLAQAQQQPARPPRQRVDIVMCDLLAEWWVRRMLAHGKTIRPGAPARKRSHV